MASEALSLFQLEEGVLPEQKHATGAPPEVASEALALPQLERPLEHIQEWSLKPWHYLSLKRPLEHIQEWPLKPCHYFSLKGGPT